MLYIVNLQSFMIYAKTELRAREKAEGILKRCTFQPVIDSVEAEREFDGKIREGGDD